MSHNQIYDAIKDNWEKYSDDVVKEIKKSVKKISLSARKEVIEKSPKLTGEYSRAWRRITSHETENNIHIFIHQAKRPSLTYILEYGKRYQGSRKYPIKGQRPHIDKVEQKANIDLSNRIDNILKKQGKK